MLTQFVEDLVHLERRRDGLDEHGGADRAVLDAQVLLAEGEDVVPQRVVVAQPVLLAVG